MRRMFQFFLTRCEKCFNIYDNLRKVFHFFDEMRKVFQFFYKVRENKKKQEKADRGIADGRKVEIKVFRAERGGS